MTIRDCTDARLVIDRALDGRAAPGDEAALDAHLRACVPCREARRVAVATADLFALEREAGPMRAPDGLAERVRSGLHGAVFRTTIWRDVLPTIRRLSIAAAVVAVASIGLSPFVGPRSISSAPLLALAARSLRPAERFLLVPEAGPSAGETMVSLLREVRR